MSQRLTIKVGAEYYMRPSSIIPWSIMTSSEYLYGGDERYDFKKATYDVYGCEMHNIYFNLIKVRYIGNGVFKEILTNMKFKAIGRDSKLNYCDNYGKSKDDSLSAILDLDDYLYISKEVYAKDENLQTFLKQIDNYKKTVQKCIACFSDTEYSIFPISTKLDESYTSVSDEERKKVLLNGEKESLGNNAIVIKELCNAYNKFATPTPELIEQAYQENEAYNLTLISKESKDS